MRRLFLITVHINNILLLFLIGAIILKVWQNYPANHCGIDVRYGFILCIVNVIVCTVGICYYGKVNWFLIGICLGILSGIFLFFIDYYQDAIKNAVNVALLALATMRNRYPDVRMS